MICELDYWYELINIIINYIIKYFKKIFKRKLNEFFIKIFALLILQKFKPDFL